LRCRLGTTYTASDWTTFATRSAFPLLFGSWILSFSPFLFFFPRRGALDQNGKERGAGANQHDGILRQYDTTSLFHFPHSPPFFSLPPPFFFPKEKKGRRGECRIQPHLQAPREGIRCSSALFCLFLFSFFFLFQWLGQNQVKCIGRRNGFPRSLWTEPALLSVFPPPSSLLPFSYSPLLFPG